MRIIDVIGETAGVGKIVKGINTTPDVHPGEIKRQAAKMYLGVDNDGRPPIANPNGSDAVKESVSGKEMLNIFRRQHHDTPGLNKQMEQWIRGQKWGMKMIAPDDLPDHDADTEDPFNRVIYLDDSRVSWYEHKLKAGQKIEPIIMGPNGSVIDGNHRAQAAKDLHQSILAYVPMESLDEEVWDQKNPKKHHKHLSPAQKSAAKARAKRAGRPYPNLIDNMWASRK